MMELFQERMVGLCCDEVVDHIDGGGEKDLYIGIARGISDAFGQIGLTHPGLPIMITSTHSLISDNYNSRLTTIKIPVS